MAGVLPSVGPEACATVLMEAMASGKPMIASNVGGNPDIVDDNVNGLLVRPGDRPGLAQAISALAADEGLRRRLAAGALRKVAAFKASNVVPRIEAVYRDVLARKRPAAATVDSAVRAIFRQSGRASTVIGFREVESESAIVAIAADWGSRGDERPRAPRTAELGARDAWRSATGYRRCLTHEGRLGSILR